jgi:dimethylhistidine N-methyltransferase
MSAVFERARADYSSPFARDVMAGLSRSPKSLPCKWFYDSRGSELFEAITQTEEYYPTRVETRLLRELAPQIPNILPELDLIIEPGSGSSIKTRLLLEAQPALRAYVPMDISAEFLMASTAQLQADFPRLNVNPIVADFTQPLAPLAVPSCKTRLIFFPGSTIGNFSPDAAVKLLKQFRTMSGPDSWLLIGVDMTQDIRRLVPAYDDAGGITRAFNKNILMRANRELDANFDPEKFAHQVIFNESEGRIEMHLVSQVKQHVSINGASFSFAEGESIHTENCYKYTRQTFEALSRQCGWRTVQVWQDETESAFGVFLMRAIGIG